MKNCVNIELMKIIAWLGFGVALSALGSACSKSPGDSARSLEVSPMESFELGKRSTLVVYLSAADGREVTPGGAARSDVRLMLRKGKVPQAYTALDDGVRTVDEGSGYRRTFPEGKPYEKGILHFETGRGLAVSVWQPIGLDSRDGFIQVEPNVFLQYTYFANKNEEDRLISEFVLRWYDGLRHQ